MNEISEYLKIDNRIYKNYLDKFTKEKISILVNELTESDRNAMMLSFLVNRGYNSYTKECSKCYNMFSDSDGIMLYDKDMVDEYNHMIFGESLTKQNIENDKKYNVLYYDEASNLFYSGIKYNNDLEKIIMELKEYKQEDEYLYFDYYFTRIIITSNDVSLHNIYNEKVLDNISITDILNDDYIPIYTDKYNEYYNVIRYTFKYNRKLNSYTLSEISIEK